MRRLQTSDGSKPADFLTFLWWRRPLRLDDREPKQRRGGLNSSNVQLFQAIARCEITSTGIAVVGDGNVDVGNETATRKPGQPRTESPRLSGVMAQQSGDSGRGHQSAPQKLLQLVGCRESKPRPEPRLRANPTQR